MWKYCENVSTLIHYAGGIGRTGIFAVMLLKTLGFSFEEALKITNDAGSDPATQEQMGYQNMVTLLNVILR